MLRAKFAILALAGIVAASVAARADNIDFTLLSPGATVTNQYPGVVFSLQGGPDSTGAPMVWTWVEVTGLANSNNNDYPTANILDIAFSSPVSGVTFTFDNNGDNGTSFYTALSGATVVDTNSLPIGSGYNLVTVSGSGITDLQLNNGYDSNTSWYFQLGDLAFTPGDVAPTPEPSSLLLFGSGVLGMAGMLRRKLLAR